MTVTLVYQAGKPCLADNYLFGEINWFFLKFSNGLSGIVME